MRRTFPLLVVLLASCMGFAQHAPKFTTPQIVATFQRMNQTGEIRPATIYTPKAWGMFRVSIVMVTTETGNNGSWQGTIEATDGGGRYDFGMSVDANLRSTGVGEFPLRVKSGTPLKFSVTSVGDPFGSKYNVWIVVEQLM